MFTDCINTKKQGDIGLGVAIAYFVKTGHTVSIPLTDSQDYDLITDYCGRINRVQVKTTSFKRNNHYIVGLTIKGGNKSRQNIKIFDKTKVDYIFVLTSDNTQYLIPSAIVGNTITLWDKYKSYIVM